MVLDKRSEATWHCHFRLPDEQMLSGRKNDVSMCFIQAIFTLFHHQSMRICELAMGEQSARESLMLSQGGTPLFQARSWTCYKFTVASYV